MSSEAPETPGPQEPPQADEPTTSTQDEQSPEAPAEPEVVELPAGEALDEREAEEVMKALPTKVVLLVGQNDAGKTSLLCGIYESYSRGDFAGHLFAGSRTLRAFEQRSFLQRAESRRKRPDMQRTRLPAGQTRLLHLDLQSKASGERVGLLATDLAGEAFELIRNDSDECERYPIFGRVDCVTVLLDAERLGTDDRHAHINSTRTTLRSMLQSETLRDGVPIVVALSKWDVVTSKAAKELATRDGEQICSVAKTNPVELVRIAAAPTGKGAVEAGHGLGPLVTRWLSLETPASSVRPNQPATAPSETDSAFDSFRPDGEDE